MIFLPLNPIELHAPFTIITKTVHRGDVLIYTVDYCKDPSIGQGEVYRSLQDDILYNLPPTSDVLQPGCHKQNIAVEIPNIIHPGKYTMKIITSYKINTLRTLTLQETTGEFEIIQ
jgi:hypothetical protein